MIAAENRYITNIEGFQTRLVMGDSIYRGGIIGLGFIGGADQVPGDALGQRVENLDGTHLQAMLNHPAHRQYSS